MKYLGSMSGALIRVSEVVANQIIRKEVFADCVVSGSGSSRLGLPLLAVLAAPSLSGFGSAGPLGLVRS